VTIAGSSQLVASALLTDLYQLTMLQSYYEEGMEDTAVFEFFVRRLPEYRNFMLFAGLEQVLEYIENLHFSQEELEWLERSGRYIRRCRRWPDRFPTIASIC